MRTTRSFGQAYLLAEVCKDVDLRRKLHKALGRDGDSVLALAMTMVVDPPLKNVRHAMEDSCLAEICQARSSFTSQSISDLLERLSRNEQGMWRFYSSLVNEEENVLVYDMTSLSPYAKGIKWLGYGDDYRKLDLPQGDLGLVVSVERRIPIHSKLFPGGVNDVSTLKNDLDLLPLRVHKNEPLASLIFVYFVALVVRSLLLQRAMRAKLLDIVLEMTKFRVVQIGSSLKLSEVTKRQRTILEKMGAPVPVKPDLDIRLCGI